MSKFIKNLLLFSIFFHIVNMSNILLSEYITHRTWEAISYTKFNVLSYGPFYHNISTNRTEFGDLAHHTSFALKKENVIWQTDKLGYRNNHFMYSPDILLIGDSNLVGSGLSQENTLVNIINNDSNYKAYSIAPGNFHSLNQLLLNKVIEAPKIIVFEWIERNLIELKPIPNLNATKRNWLINKIRLNKMASVFSAFYDEIFTPRPLLFLEARIAGELKAQIMGEFGTGLQSPVDSSFFFFKENNIEIVPTEKNINTVYTQIVKYKKYCDTRNIKFIFLPVPNKETIYYKYVPLQNQPDFLLHLIKRLQENDIDVINTFELFNQNKNKELLYIKDDTHWNENAVKLAYSELLKHILTY